MVYSLLLIVCVRANASGTSGTVVPFDIPFDTATYDEGPLVATSDDGMSGAAVYWRTDESNLYIGMASNDAGTFKTNLGP